jgi:hypothetical protein
MPPITTMATIRPQQVISHQPTTWLPARGAASCRLENVRVIAKSPTPIESAIDGAIRAAGQMEGFIRRASSRNPRQAKAASGFLGNPARAAGLAGGSRASEN